MWAVYTDVAVRQFVLQAAMDMCAQVLDLLQPACALLLLLLQSVYGIARTLFLVCLLGLGSYLIHSDTYRCE